ncbi:uncharacterized protein [Palaemon carinicauda]|uniref:uncharacterized protein n=1 Tax=Palaemon carinicauda TaxID=392227 RepID=UPI0035B59FC0
MAEGGQEEIKLHGHISVNIDDGAGDDLEGRNENLFREAHDPPQNVFPPPRPVQAGQTTEAHRAAMAGQEQQLREILETNRDLVSLADEKGKTPLHLAAEGLHLECCKALLEISDKKINLKDNSGYTPLLLSISSGDISYEVTKLLIEHSGNLKIITRSKQTAVHIAAEKGNVKTMKLLLETDKSNLNSKDSEKATPLHLAAKNGHVLVCQELIDIGANNGAKDSKGYTPLHCAARRGFHACMKLLISSGCQVDSADKQGNTPLHVYCKHAKNRPECITLLLEANANPNAQNQIGKTPFHLAQSQELEIRKAFEGSAIDLSVTDNKGKTALHYAAKRGNSSINVDFILKMEKKTTDMSHFINIQDAEGYTALHILASRGDLDACRSLIIKGADVNISSKRKETALHMAAQNGRKQTTELLIHKKVAVNSKNIDSLTALHMAVKNGHAECCEVLMRNRANVNEFDPENKTILHMAVEGGHISCIETILRLYPSLVGQRRGNIKTPLRIAVENNSLECCRALLNTDRTELWTEESPSPVRLAYEKGFFDIFRLLLMKCKLEERNRSFKDIDFRKLLKVALEKSNSHVVESITESVYWEESLQPYYVPDEDLIAEETPNLNLSNMVKDHDQLVKQIFDKCMPGPEQGTDYFKTEYLDEILQQKGNSHNQGEDVEDIRPSPFCPIYPPEVFDSISGKLEEGVKTNTVNQEWREKHVLALAIEKRHQTLLAHPLVKKWLQFKWNAYICYWFYISAAFAIGHAALLTAFTLVSWDWRAMYDKYGLDQKHICTFNYSLVGPEVEEMLVKEAQKPNGISYAIWTIVVLWIITNVYKFARLQERRMEMVLSGICIITDVIFLSNFTKCSRVTSVREDWQWLFGPLAVVFAYCLAYCSFRRHPFYDLRFFSFRIYISAAKDIILPLILPLLICFVFYILISKGSLTLMLNMSWLFPFFEEMPSIGTLLMIILVATVFLAILVATVFLARIRSDADGNAKEREVDRIADAIDLILDFDLLFPILRKLNYVSKITEAAEKKPRCSGTGRYSPINARDSKYRNVRASWSLRNARDSKYHNIRDSWSLRNVRDSKYHNVRASWWLIKVRDSKYTIFPDELPDTGNGSQTCSRGGSTIKTPSKVVQAQRPSLAFEGLRRDEEFQVNRIFNGLPRVKSKMAEGGREEIELQNHILVNIDDGAGDDLEGRNENIFREAHEPPQNVCPPPRPVQPGQTTEAHRAAMAGQEQQLREILETNRDLVSLADEKGKTPLHLAAEGLHLECCKALLEISDIKINLKDNSGYTPLLLSISSGDISYEVTKLLIKHSGNLKIITKSKQTALHIAAEKGNVKTMKLLLKRDKSNLNSEDNEKATPLHLAAKNGHVRVCQELIGIGANNGAKDSKGYTPLHCAARRGFHACMKLLISSGCQVDSADKQGNTPLHVYCKHAKNRPECITLLLEANANPNARNKIGKTPFHLAQSQELEIRKAFEGSAIDLSVTDNKGKTVLHYAAKKGNSSINVDFILKMEKKTTDMSHFINIQDAEGYTALHILASRGELDACRFLIIKGADVNISSKRKETALHMAAQNGHKQTTALLIHKKVAVNSENIDSLTALHMAVKNGHAECSEVLMRNRANVNEFDPENKTILHMAVEGGHISCIETILRLYPSLVGQRRGNIKTPLHIAVENNSLEYCRALLNTDKIELWTEESPSPVRLAYEKGFFDIFDLLLRKCKLEDRNQTFKDIDFRKLLKVALEKSNSQVVKSITESVYWKESLQPYYVLDENLIAEETPNLNLSNMVKDHDQLVKQIFDKCMPDPEQGTYYFKTEYLDEILQQKGNSHNQGEDVEDIRPSPFCPVSPPKWRKQHVLALAVQGRHQTLLAHPLVKKWLQFKWNAYICCWFYISAALATGHAALLTAFALVSWDWRAMYDKYGLDQKHICTFNYSLVGPEVEEMLVKEAQKPNGISYAIWTIVVLWIITNVYKFARLQERRMKMVLSGICIITDVIFLSNFTKCSRVTSVREDWQWLFGPLPVVFAYCLAYYSFRRHPFYDLRFFSFRIYISAAKDIILPLILPLLICVVFYILTSKGSLTLMLNMSWLFPFFEEMPSIGTLLMIILVAIVFLARIRSDADGNAKEREVDRIAGAIDLILDFDLLFPTLRKLNYVSKITEAAEKKPRCSGTGRYSPI